MRLQPLHARNVFSPPQSEGEGVLARQSFSGGEAVEGSRGRGREMRSAVLGIVTWRWSTPTRETYWAGGDSNPRSRVYETPALTTKLPARRVSRTILSHLGGQGAIADAVASESRGAADACL